MEKVISEKTLGFTNISGISETILYYMPISLMILKRATLIWEFIYLFIPMRICKRGSGKLVPWNSYLLICIYLGQNKLQEVLREKKENLSQSISKKGMCVTDRKRQGYRKQQKSREQARLQKSWKPLNWPSLVFSDWGSNSIFEVLLFLCYLLLLFSSPNIIFSSLCKIK